MEFGVESETKDFVVERNGKRFIDLTKILPERLPSGKLILWKQIDEEKIEIFVDKHSAPGGNPKPIRIKRFIEINEDLFTLFGLWFGDGNRIRGGNWKAFGFANTEIELHKLFLSLCKKCLFIDPHQFFCAISVPLDFNGSIKELEEQVSRELKIPLGNFWKTIVNERRNLVHIDTRINSRLLSFSMKILLEKLQKLALEEKRFSKSMLQGIIASEANVHVRSDSGRLGEISVAVEGEIKRNFVRNLFLNLGIKPSKDKTIEHQEAVLIHGLTNFKKVKEWNLIALHPKKLKDFERGIEGFKKEEFRKGEAKLLILKSLSKSSKNVSELAKELGRAWRSIVDHLWVLEDLELVGRKRVGRKVFWFITERGKEMLEEKDVLEKLRIGLPRKNG